MVVEKETLSQRSIRFSREALLNDISRKVVSYAEEKFDRYASRLNPIGNRKDDIAGVLYQGKKHLGTLSFLERVAREDMVFRKKMHTMDTVRETIALHQRLMQTGECADSPMDLTLLKIIALLHDAERPAEGAIHGTWEGAQTKFKHHKLMAFLFSEDFGDDGQFRKEGKKMEAGGYSRAVIAEAIAEHSEPEYLGDFVEAHFIRDVDKTAITDRFEWLLEDKIQGAVTKELFLSDGTLDEFEVTGRVTNGNMRTPLDGLLRTLAWWNNIHFRATKEIWHERGYVERILNQLIIWGIQPEQFERVLRVVDGWMQKDEFVLDRSKLQNLDDFLS